LLPKLKEEKIESVAIGFLHAYANPANECRAAEIISATRPDLSISLSSEVCPEVREYERLSTTCANAYVQPLMSRYLLELEAELKNTGIACPLLLMMSSGGLTTLATGIKFPIRLIDSGPAGGAILARDIAAVCGAQNVLSFDMGGTTAKICLIDNGVAQTSRGFEVARAYRHSRGSGLPIRIPAVEMVEIGAGGGSIATVDSMRRINVGPESAGAEPGPACYGLGGKSATVTDADVRLGRVDPKYFAGGVVQLLPDKSGEVLAANVGAVLNVDDIEAACMVVEIVNENMANAARVHTVERGKDMTGRTIIAFGGAAPLHGARMAEKLGLNRVIVPTGAGVGSAIGFLRAPISYEVVRSRFTRLNDFELTGINDMLADMHAEAEGVVRLGVPKGDLAQSRTADMRYVGQGHEISVSVPVRALTQADINLLQESFDESYSRQYGRTIPGVDVEILSWTVTVSHPTELPTQSPEPEQAKTPPPSGWRRVIDGSSGSAVDFAVHPRVMLKAGMKIEGPALIVEDATTTLVPLHFDANINSVGFIIMNRHEAG
jgi:N-methylhydantoinase A